jgi:divalent anion:Na+ symporter, DASS family
MQSQTKYGALLFCALVAAVFWLFPAPEGVPISAVRLLGIFLATIIGIVLKVMPMGAVALLGISATVVTNTLTFPQAFAGFDNQTVWLIVAAFFIARGFTKTGLGNRIAYIFVRMLGRRTLGLSYGLLTTEFILSPAIPSSTARAGGVIFPILTSLSRSFGSDPEMGTARRMGSFLTMVSIHGTIISSAMFLTAMAVNPYITDFARDQGINISWGSWALAALVPGLFSLIFMPLIVYKIFPPGVKETPHAAKFADDKLSEMGRMKKNEWIMFFTFVGLLVLWMFGKSFGMSATAAALIGLSALLITGVLQWNDILSEKGAWETLFWFAALIAMASQLSEQGIIEWVGGYIGSAAEGLSWPVATLLLALAYFYMHYFFASLLAHVVSMYPIFLTVMITVGAPPMAAALLLGFLSNLYGALTHYASGPAAIFYGSHYVHLKDWWRISFIISVFNILVWLSIGGLWWKLIGIW